jgi:hypothetical protein
VHIYAFGSLCRGDISFGSDVDLIAIVEGYDARFDPEMFSIYSYARIRELWNDGNPFAWHLFLEAKLLFSTDREDSFRSLGTPSVYTNYVRDCEKFFGLFREAYASVCANSYSKVFELSVMFLSIRNIATCFSLGVLKQPDFSRGSALHLGTKSIPLSQNCYDVLERARLLCTRGHGRNITIEEACAAIKGLRDVCSWMDTLVEKAKEHERV